MDSVLAQITAAKARGLVQALVGTPSVNPPGETAAAVAVLGRYLDAAGVPWRTVAAKPGVANLVARLPGRLPGRTLVFNGHVDVVPPGENWTVDPFGGEERDGRIYGRGSCDMKGGLAAMLLAVLALQHAGAPFAGEVLFTAVADEETGGEYGTQYILREGIGRGADFAIVGEPSNLRVELGNRGVAWLEVTVKGRAGHPGHASGANAVHYAGKLIEAIAGMRFDLHNDLFEVPSPSVTVTMVHGGVKANVIPSTCTLTLDRRLLPGETAAAAVVEVEELIASLPVPGVNAEVRLSHASEPYLVSPSEPLVQALVLAHEHVLGTRPAFGAKGGSTDGAFLYHQGGVPTVLYGPGDPGLAHTADEHVALESVVQAAQVYARTALDLLREDGH